MGTMGPVLWILSALTLNHALELSSRVSNPAHNDRVCSTWGNFHYKTFDGDIFQFPGPCNYLFSSNCKNTFEDFNIQIRRSVDSQKPVLSYVVIKIEGLVIEMKKKYVIVGGELVSLPFNQFGVQIQRTSVYVKVSAKLGLTLLWNNKDALMLELSSKYMNTTCGLCGNMNGLSQDEFQIDDVLLTPVQFGNLQKFDGPTEHCEDVISPVQKDCSDLKETCVSMLSSPAFDDCNIRLPQKPYIEACVSDLCNCQSSNDTSCFCNTLAEYSRQCAHAGGRPSNWRNNMCEITCPMSLQYDECGSPCADTCSNFEQAQVCEEHCIDGCFCPPGTVFDDVNHQGCVPLSECSCTYNNTIYAPGESYSTNCRNCTCQGGKWSCQDLPCAGYCSLEGGSHIHTYDGSHYNFHGQCDYIFTKDCVQNMFTVLVELTQCGVTNTETCLKSVTLSLDKGLTVLSVKSSGTVLLNGMYTSLPLFTDNLAVLQPSSFYLIVKSFIGIQIQIQLNPLMQISVSLDPEYKGDACGLCGNFNDIQTDDFRAGNGLVEGTASGFANSWKMRAACPDVSDSFENPCSLSVENERFAQYWCSQLSDSNGIFAPCHAAVHPEIYQKNCMYDSCNYEKSEDSVCAALSAYVRACTAEGVILTGWRGVICDKYTKNCPKNSTYQYAISTCQKTCRSLSDPDPSCSFKLPTVDGCACPNGTYLNDRGACVPDKQCPCYYKGSIMPPGEVVYNKGAMCTCQSGRLHCVGNTPSIAVCPDNMVYFDCANASKGGKGAECQKTCQTLDMECFSIQCASGCVCPDGLVLSNDGSCIPEEECPCVYNGEIHQSGETIQQDCNTCTCKERKWQCTQNECHRTCVVYGEGHYVTFDGKRFDFSGDCEYTLTQDYCLSNSGNGSFRVITENIPCGTTGATCSKAIKVFLGNFELKLSEGSYEVVERDIGSEVPYQVRKMGIYLVIEARNGLILMWDKKTSILIKLSPEFKGRVCGLCGNYDGSVSNDFITRSQSVVVNIQEFGNSWKAAPTCPDALPLKDPCVANPYRQTWSQKHCSFIMGSTFSKCHSMVDPSPYHDACVQDTCACDSGGDCECYCTAVAAYAAACSQAGICVSWRTPEICPLFCDYYNPEGECEWHYKPCGAPCMKTCRNPSGRCMNTLPGLEGCYPKCPKERPFFDEDIMKCVAQANCGCYDDDGKRYSVGDMVPSYKNCESCICTKKGRRCQMDERACYCYYGNMKYNYGDVIYNTTDGIGGCITATCSFNGTIARNVYPCVPTTKAPTTTFHFDTTSKIPLNISTPEPMSSTSVSCLKEVCKWSPWYDVTYPKYGIEEGDFETFDNIRKKGYSVCEVPSQVECRAKKFPQISVSDLGQKIQCNTSVGLVCYNRDQFSELCFNYEISILCCTFVPCGESSASPTPFVTSSPSSTLITKSLKTTTGTLDTKSSEKTTPRTSTIKSVTETVKPSTTKPQATTHNTPCQKEMCTWTPWIDVDFPSIEYSDGDFETIENIKAAGNNICSNPEGIECRAEKFPSRRIEEVGQIVTCNVTHGLICYNKDQENSFPLCYNYQIKILCCSMEDCEASTTLAPSTAKVHSTKHPTTPEFTRTAQQFTKTTTMGAHTTMTVLLTTKIPLTVQSTKYSTHITGIQTTSSKVNCVPVCEWSQWFDVSFPNSDTNGDFETYEDIRNSGFKVCQEPSDIQCRSSDLPDLSLEELQQNVYCNISNGLICRNEEQTGPFPYCYNYEIRVYCCSECASTEAIPTTYLTTTLKAATSVPQTTKNRVTLLPTSTYESTTDFEKLTTDEDVYTYTPKKTQATVPFTEPLEKITEITTSVNTQRPISTTIEKVTSAYKTTPGKPMTSETMYPKETTLYRRSTTGGEHEETTSQKLVSMKTTKMSTESGEVTSTFKTTGKMTSAKASTSFSKPNTESEHVSSGKPIQTTKMSTESHEVTSANKTTPGKPMTSETLSPKETTVYRRSTTEGEHEETTSQKLVSMKTTKMSTESGEVTSAFKTTGKITSAKANTDLHKSTTEAEHEDMTSRKPVTTARVSTESHEVTSAYKTTPGKPMTSETLSPKQTTVYSRSTTEGEPEETTSQKLVSVKTTKMSTESGEVTSAFKTTGKMTSAKASTSFSKPNTESEHVSSGKPIQTTKMSTESHEVTSAYKTSPGKPMTSETMYPKETTTFRRSTTEAEHEKTTSQKLVSVKTTKMSTESGEVTSAFKTTGKITSAKANTDLHKSTTEAEHEDITSRKPVTTARVSTESHEVTSAYKTTPGKPMTSETLSPKQTTVYRRSTTEGEHEETSSQKIVSMKTTKMSTESGEVTSAFKTTGKMTSAKASTSFSKPNTESEHVSSGKPIQTTKMSTESHEVTSANKTSPGKPMTSETMYPKETTTFRRSTTEAEHEDTTSQKLVSVKTTKMSTESGEVTSAFKTTGKITSAKANTDLHKSTTEAEHEDMTSRKPVTTARVSTESHEVTSAYKTTPGKPMTSETLSPKETTVYKRSTTEGEHEETTSQKLVSMKTTKMSTESGEVTSAFKTTGKMTSAKASTSFSKPNTESEHVSSGKPIQTTKMSTESHEVTSAYKTSPGKPMTSETMYPKETTTFRRSTTEAEHEETTSQKLVSVKTTKMSTESGEVTSAFKTTGKITSAKANTDLHKSTTEAEHEDMTSRKPVTTARVSTESHEVTSAYKTTPGKPMTSETLSPKETTVYKRSTTEGEHEETTSQKLVSMKTTKMSTESGEVTSAFKTTGKMTSAKASTSFSKPNTESEHVSSGKPIQTTKMSTESHEVTSAYKTTPGKPMTSETMYPKETTTFRRSTTEAEHEETTSQKLVSVKTTKMSTESGEVTSAFKTTGKITSAKANTDLHKSTTEAEHEDMTSRKPVTTARVSTESYEVTSAYKTTPGKPMTSETLSPKETTVYRRSTTEGEHEETTSQKLVSMKTTKMSTESGEVTSAFKTTGKMTSAKASTSFSKPNTESEHVSSGIPIQTTKMSTESHEVTSSYKTSPGKPMTSETMYPKETTTFRRSTTEAEHEETTSQKPVSVKTTKMSTESGEVTSAFKTTGKMTSAKPSTTVSKPTTESEHVTSGKPIQTTKVSTESHEVTSTFKTTPGKPMTSETIYPIATTAYRRSTTEDMHKETTSQKFVSVKTTKMSTESGEVTSAFKTTGKITSAKANTDLHKSTTEAEHGDMTSRKPVTTARVSTEFHEVTSGYKTTPGKPMTSETMSPKVTTVYRRSTTEGEHEETTSQKLVSVKTTKMSTESGEVTSAFKTTGKITSAKASTTFSKPTTESGHVTSGKPSQTTKVSTESHEVTATSNSIFSSKSISEGTLSTNFNSQQPSKSTHQSMYPTSGKVSTERTVTTTSQLTTATTESFSTVRCMCNINRVLVSPGQVIYNTTDNAGWCFYAKCNQNCEVERYSEQCYSSTVPTVTSSTKTSKTVTASAGTMTTNRTESTTKKSETSTKTSQTSHTKTSTSSVISTSTINPGCSALMPPRVVNETWMIDNCTQARCTGGNNIVINKKQCAPINEVVCANRLQPQKIYDESGCCYERECQCVCGGWGTSNYITFDGTYYSFNGQCTYVLVQQITPVFDHFRVYIDNFSCNPDDPNCVKTLRIMYKTDTIVLKSQSLIKRIFNQIYINEERVYPAIYRNGILITTSGIFVIVEIPELGAYISFNALSFTVKLPISKFSGNTQGHCGKCSNNRIDDCILPNGQLAPSCTQMAGQWNAPSVDSTCSSIPTTSPTGIPSQSTLPFSSLSPTYFSTLTSSVPHIVSTRVPSTELSYLPSTSLTTEQVIWTDEPCNAPGVCTLILSSVFEECHSVVPPEPFYQACVSDGCTKSQGDILCSSLQSYARICGIEGVCIDWRNSTNGLCSMNCSSHLVYNPCGPAVERTCDCRYNDAFLKKSTEDFMEGCYCPENMTKYNAVSDKCVSTCGCTGPDGMPREPGETWDSNCQTCRCDNTSMSVMCVEKSCALSVPENCTKEGYMPVSVPDLSDPCCLVTECRCNVSLCANTKKVCEPGYEAVLYTSPEECCPVYKCEPKDVCLHNGTEYQPGTPVLSSNPCEKCMCDENMNESTGIYHVSCTPVICDKTCAQGFKYTKVPGQCCGTCEQTECIMDLPDNSTHLLKPGDTWSPPGDNCTEYECVRKKDKLLTVVSKISCPRINLDECVPEHPISPADTIQKDPSGCCVTCMIKEKKCQKVKTENIVLQNGCKSIKPVEMSYCKGNCESYSKYSVESQSMEEKCVCCQETETEKISIGLTCPNGKTMNYSFINVKNCSCVDTTCKKEYKQNSKEDDSEDDNKSDSNEKEVDGKDNIVPVTKPGPSISNKPMKTTRQLQEKKDKDDINRENSKENESFEQNNKSDSKEKVDKENVSPVTKTVPGLTTKPMKTTRQLQEKKDKDEINRENIKENESSEQNNKSDSKEKVDKEKVSPVTKKVPGLTNKPMKTTRQL